MPKIDLAKVEETRGSRYPKPFDEPVRGRRVAKLGDAGGLTQFGVNLVTIPPGGWSSQRHWHTREDELVYVVAGELVLVTDDGDAIMRPGDVATFKAGSRDGHHLQNRTTEDARFLVVGSRDPQDAGEYSDIDMVFVPEAPHFRRKDGTPY